MTDQQTGMSMAGVPQDAIKRLSELQPGKAGSIFTSDLSVNEFLLVREAGFRPLGLVLGTSIYHVGLQVGRWGKNQELTVLSQALYHARELAMTRMEAEADALGADGIVGVRLDVEMKEFGSDIAEFIAIGTAVKAEPNAGGGGVDNWRNNKRQPFTSDLSGQDFWTLIRAGYAPLGMVMGSCVYHIAHQRMGSVIGNIGRNVEIEQFTQALYDARELIGARGRSRSRFSSRFAGPPSTMTIAANASAAAPLERACSAARRAASTSPNTPPSASNSALSASVTSSKRESAHARPGEHLDQLSTSTALPAVRPRPGSCRWAGAGARPVSIATSTIVACQLARTRRVSAGMPRSRLDVHHQRVEAGGELLGEDRGDDQRQQLDRAGRSQIA